MKEGVVLGDVVHAAGDRDYPPLFHERPRSQHDNVPQYQRMPDKAFKAQISDIIAGSGVDCTLVALTKGDVKMKEMGVETQDGSPDANRSLVIPTIRDIAHSRGTKCRPRKS